MSMNVIIDWLSNHKWINAVILALYFGIVVLPHKRFGTFLNEKVFVGITRAQYNLYTLLIAGFLLVLYLFLFFRNARRQDHTVRLWFYMVLNIILACIIISILFVINIEVIHFPQYAVFAFLLFPIVGNYNETLIWSTLAGAMDEAYQYFYLAPGDTGYYDFNDVISNLAGAVFGLLLLSSFGVLNKKAFDIKRSKVWLGIGFIALAVIILHVSGLLSIYPNDDRPYHILRSWPPGFWSKVYPNVTFHVIRPLEGLGLLIVLFCIYRKIAP